MMTDEAEKKVLVECCPQQQWCEWHANGKPKGRCLGCDAPVRWVVRGTPMPVNNFKAKKELGQ